MTEQEKLEIKSKILKKRIQVKYIMEEVERLEHILYEENNNSQN